MGLLGAQAAGAWALAINGVAPSVAANARMIYQQRLRSVLEPLHNNEFVAIEPVFSPDQGLIARLTIAADRGRYVRDAEGYESLLSLGFENVSSEVIHGRLRIPYSHIILTATHSDQKLE